MSYSNWFLFYKVTNYFTDDYSESFTDKKGTLVLINYLRKLDVLLAERKQFCKQITFTEG